MVNPAADCALAKAIPKSSEMPMTSPVDFISGPSRMSRARELEEREHRLLDEDAVHGQVLGEPLVAPGSGRP